MRITSKGQVTIRGGAAQIRKARRGAKTRGRMIVEHLRGRATPGSPRTRSWRSREAELFTRDARRYRTHFPKLELIAP